MHLCKKTNTGLALLRWDTGQMKLKCTVALLQGNNENSRSRFGKVMNIFSERQELFNFFCSHEFLANVVITSII